ncbi:MAG: hypothetical protein ACYDHP_12025 [Ferrimicrobium sp.]
MSHIQILEQHRHRDHEYAAINLLESLQHFLHELSGALRELAYLCDHD